MSRRYIVVIGMLLPEATAIGTPGRVVQMGSPATQRIQRNKQLASNGVTVTEKTDSTLPAMAALFFSCE